MMKRGNSRSLLNDIGLEVDYGAMSEEEVELTNVVTNGNDPNANTDRKSKNLKVSGRKTSDGDKGAHGASRRLTLAWKDVQVFAELRQPWYRRKCCDTGVNIKVHVLRGVSGIVRSGCLLAVLGTSGSGKSRLLDVLSSRNVDGLQIRGLVTVNGRPIGKRIRALSSRVDEDNAFMGMLTIREYLYFYAQLGMHGRSNEADRKDKVNEIMNELGLDRFADFQLRNNGSSHHYRLSESERSKLSFACKVLHDKEIMFCDDLTAGMDTFTALTIVRVLKKLTSRGKILICSLKQPPSGVYDMFDRVIYLAEGRVAYFGDTVGALTFFNSVGFKVPSNYNPADFFIHTLSVASTSRPRIEDICDKYETTLYHKKLQKRIVSEVDHIESDQPKKEDADSVDICRAPFAVQVRALLWHLWLSTVRDPKGIRLIVFLTLVMGVLLGAIYFQQRSDQHAILNINGAILFMILQASSTPLFIASIKYSFLLPRIMQDIRNGMYQVLPVYLIVSIFELIVCSFAVAMYGSIVYWMAGLYPHARAFFTCISTLLLAAHASLSIGHMIIASTPGPASAVAIATAIVPHAMLFTGLFVHLSSIPGFLSWLPYLSWFRYAFGIIVINQWKHVETLDCPHANQTVQAGSRCITTGQGVITFMDFEDASVVVGVLIELLIILLARGIALAILSIRSKRKW